MINKIWNECRKSPIISTILLKIINYFIFKWIITLNKLNIGIVEWEKRWIKIVSKIRFA
jgi:hypothetical protein